MASGHVKCRVKRPNTWQLRPAVRKKDQKSLANKEPSTHGTVFAGPALLWGVATFFLPSRIDCTIEANQSIAACEDVTIGGDVNLGNSQ